jgi:aerotaxis receptor
MGTLIRSLLQIQINLRAVVGDVRGEIASLTQSAAEIAAGGMDLSARTAASMEELSSTVKNTADTAQQVSAQSLKSTQMAAQGGEAVHKVG